ncbi:MAG: sodium:solute symporter, partial [Sphingobacteriia bacterium]
GGAKAVAYTQQLQLAIIFGGMLAAGYFMVSALPDGIGFGEALSLGGVSGKLNVITTGFTPDGFDWKDRYNLVSGTIGGLFLALSYFGTDQSQVGRYLTAKSTTESRMGLLLNGLVKIPMQFSILLLGALLFVFYQFNASPVFFNRAVEEKALQTPYRDSLTQLKTRFDTLQFDQLAQSKWYLQAPRPSLKDSIRQQQTQIDFLRKDYKRILAKASPGADTNDTNYIFLRYVVDQLPTGLVGLLIAIIFLAAWGSIAAALNSLASCTMIDFHQRFSTGMGQEQAYTWSKGYTFLWGVFCIITAQFASGLGSLIEAVNVLGSLFYGVILGIFLAAFYVPFVKGRAVFWAAVLGELGVIALFLLDRYGYLGLGFLWLNVAGALLVLVLALLFQFYLSSLGKKQ